MGLRERMLDVLVEREEPLCDDCVVEPADMKRRQQANDRGRQLEDMGVIRRGVGTCSQCHKYKTVSVPTGIALPDRELVSPASEGQPWHWEGNVQAALVTHLNAQGYELVSQANTATKESGIDVVARDPYGREWWITVKGYPEDKPGKKTRATVQAPHWFASAMFDIVKYRTDDTAVMLGVALPEPFTTYERLQRRSSWLQQASGFRYFLVSEDGSVSEG